MNKVYISCVSFNGSFSLVIYLIEFGLRLQKLSWMAALDMDSGHIQINWLQP